MRTSELVARQGARAFRREELALEGRSCRRVGLEDPDRRREWLDHLGRLVWVIGMPPVIESGDVAVGYMSRYMQKTAIGNSRIESIDLDRETVTFSYRDNHANGRNRPGYKLLTLPAIEFIDRFMQHVYPLRCSRTRYWGLWSTRKKNEVLPRLRAALGVPAPASESDASGNGEGDACGEGEGNMSEGGNEGQGAPDEKPRRCPFCKQLALMLEETVPRPSMKEIMYGLYKYWHHTSIALRKARAKRAKEAKRAAKAEAERRKRREETYEGGSDSGGLFESERLLE